MDMTSDGGRVIEEGGQRFRLAGGDRGDGRLTLSHLAADGRHHHLVGPRGHHQHHLAAGAAAARHAAILAAGGECDEWICLPPRPGGAVHRAIAASLHTVCGIRLSEPALLPRPGSPPLPRLPTCRRCARARRRFDWALLGGPDTPAAG